MLVHKKILIAVNIRKRGIEGPNQRMPYKKEEEIVDLLFLHCSFSLVVWEKSIKNLGISPKMLAQISGFFMRWNHLYQGLSQGGKSSCKNLEGAPHVYQLVDMAL